MSDLIPNPGLSGCHGEKNRPPVHCRTSPASSPSASPTEILSAFMKKNEQENRADLLVEKCGVFGCIANGDWPTNLGVASIVGLGLVGLQHRGQEAAGIVTCAGPSDSDFNVHRGTGLVSNIFSEPIIASLKGNVGLGHTRYSTTGGSENVQMAQPFIVHTSYGVIAVAHNGELVNSKTLRQKILERGVGLSTGSDSELITQCLSIPPPERFRDPKNLDLNKMDISSGTSKTARNGRQLLFEDGFTNPKTSVMNGDSIPWSDQKLTHEQKEMELLSRLLHFVSLTPLSYALVIMYDECLYAVRDPFGNRPLCIGMLFTASVDGSQRSSREKLSIDGWVVSSESCSFPSVSARHWRDIEPGEIVKLERNKLPKTLALIPRPDPTTGPAFCILEHVYFARPDSIFDGQMVYAVRVKCGMRLADESNIHIPADNNSTHEVVVAPVPETSIPAALGFAQQAGLPFVEVLSRNRYIGRTFIQPSTRLRRLGVSRKFGPLTHNFKGKKVILVDDSIVRGTTIGQLVKLLKDFGAKEVHIRIASPPLQHPCYMGINISTREELIANHMDQQQLAESLGAASLYHLSQDGLRESVESGIREYHEKQGTKKPIGHCMACMTGEYPVGLDF